MSDLPIHPILRSLDPDQVKKYFDDTIEYHKSVQHEFCNADFKTVWTTTTAKKGLPASIDPQLAALISSYTKRVICAVGACPLCAINRRDPSPNPLCDEVYSVSPSDGACVAVGWCKYAFSNTVHNDDPQWVVAKKVAYDLVKSECEKRGITDLDWIPEWR